MTTEPNAEFAAVLAQVDALAVSMRDLLADLIRIPSISGTAAENDAMHWLTSVCEKFDLETDLWEIDLPTLAGDQDFPGMEVARAQAWGLVGRLPGGGGGSVLLNGHIDVVPVGDESAWQDPPFAATVRDGRMYGRGSCDMKAGVIANLWAMRALQTAGVAPPGDVLFGPVQGEEDGGLGAFALLQRGWRADVAIITEPTSLDVIPANSGALTFRLTVSGRATHAATRTAGVSAIEKFMPIWQAIAQLEADRHVRVDPMTQRWDLAHPISIGTIRAGDWPSSVPDTLVAEGRIGVALGEDPAATRADLERAVDVASAADPWLREHPVHVEWWGGVFESGQLPPDSTLATDVQYAHIIANNQAAPEVYAAPYGSDLRLLTNIGGIPTVQYGPGDAAFAHGPHEYVELAEVHQCARTLAVLIARGLGLP